MSSITQINDAAARKVHDSRCFTKGILAINLGGAATVKTTNALTYSVGGIMYSKAALSAQSIAVTHDTYGNPVATGIAAYVQPVLKTVIYVISVNAAGTVAVSQGTYAGQTVTFPNDLTRVEVGTGGVPVEPAGYTAIGAFKVALANAATFTPGTTALDATDVTVTYYDLTVLPASL